MKGNANPEAKQRIILCAPYKSCIFKAQRLFKGKAFRWIYLGEDISSFIAVERQIGKTGERVEIGDKLQEIAGALRQPYIDYIGNLSLANNSLLWWLSCISDKNPWFSKSLLYACYVKLCQDIVNSSGAENLIFIGENKAIRESIAENINDLSPHRIQHIKTSVRDCFDVFKDIGKSILIKVNYFRVITYRMWLTRHFRLKMLVDSHSQDKKRLVLLQNWIDERSFNQKGEYYDIYFGQLAHHLRNKGKNIVIIPYILDTVSYSQTLKKLDKTLGNFLLPESYLTLPDILRIFCKTLFHFQEKWVYPALEGIKISGIIAFDLRKYLERTDLTSNLLLFESIKRWKKANIPIETFIYPYESHTWEKAYCLALRKYYPSVKIIGYQHSTVPKMLLNYFFSIKELQILPFPDRVITTGKYTEKLFKESGYDPAKVICGSAIRYNNLVQKKKLPAKINIEHPVILVTPSIDKNETIELVWKVLKAFGEMKQYKIIFKFHPACPYSDVRDKIKKLPGHFVISDKPVSGLLLESNVLLYNSSSASMEALALGVPILHVKSDFNIDRDNLADFPSDVRESVSTPGDIVKAIENLLKMNDQELARKRQLWAEVVAELFGPVDDSTYNLFL